MGTPSFYYRGFTEDIWIVPGKELFPFQMTLVPDPNPLRDKIRRDVVDMAEFNKWPVDEGELAEVVDLLREQYASMRGFERDVTISRNAEGKVVAHGEDLVSILTVLKDDEGILSEFLAAKNLTDRVSRKEVIEPAQIYFAEAKEKYTGFAMNKGLHVDKSEKPETVLVYSYDENKLEKFLKEINSYRTVVNRVDGVSVVQYTCSRLCWRDEREAIQAGALVGRKPLDSCAL